MIGWSVVGQVIYILCQFAILILLARFSSVEDVGRFGLASAITAPVFFFFQLGLRFNQATDAANEFGFSDFFLLRFISTLASLLTIAVIGALTIGDSRTMSILMLFSLAKAVEMHSDLMYGVFQKNGRLRLVAESLIMRGIFSTTIFSLVLVFSGTPVYAFLAYFLVWLTVFLVFDLPRARRLEQGNYKRASFAELWRLARNSAPLGLSGLLANLSASIPRLIIGYTAGLEELGYFTSVAYVYQGANMLIQSINQAIIGRLAQYWTQGNLKAFRSVMLKLSAALSGAALLGALVLVPFGGDILAIVFGPDYRPYGSLLVLMIVALGFNIPMSIHQTGLMAQRRFTAQLVNRAIFAALVAVFSSAGIALFGLNGAALGLATSSLLQIPVVMYLLKGAPFPPKVQ